MTFSTSIARLVGRFFALTRSLLGCFSRYLSEYSPSLFFLHERVRDLFASIDGRDDYEESATCDNEAELAIPNVTFVVYAS
jgi:hypothetical protein